MATSVRLIRRYVWLVDTVRRAGRITMPEINARWRDSTLNDMGESEIPERTLHRHRENVLELFDISIDCDRATNEYFISNPDALEHSGFTFMLFNGLSLDNELRDNKAVAKRIFFEDIGTDFRYLGEIIEAISRRRWVKLSYRKFVASVPRELTVAPYGLRQWRQRWYLLGLFDGCNRLTPFALDRIQGIEITDYSFDYNPLIDAANSFSEVIGMNLDTDYPVERIVVRIYGFQRHFIETVPLHSSQNCIHSTAEYSDYEFRLRPEWEFQHEILRLGPDAQIISPAWLRGELRTLAEEALKRYQENY